MENRAGGAGPRPRVYQATRPRRSLRAALAALAAGGLVVWLDGPAGAAAWRPVGPDGGWVDTLVYAPTFPPTIYAGVLDGGCFKSVDGGATWNAVSTGLPPFGFTSPNKSLNDLVVAPDNPMVVYAATSGGVYKTTNGGQSWSAASSGLTNTIVNDIAVHSSAPGTLYAGTTNGIFKTTNGGASWSSVSTGLPSSQVLALAIDPLSPSTVFAGTSSAGAFKSADAGGSWTAINSGLSSLDVRSLMPHPTVPGRIYAGVGGGVFESTDGGASWSARLTGVGAVRDLAQDPLTPTILYAATDYGGVLRSADSGTSWSAVNTGLMGALEPVISYPERIDSLAIDPADPATLYAGSLRAVHKTTSAGASWSVVSSGMRATRISALAVDPSAPSTLYGGLYEGLRFLKTVDGGTSWSATGTGLVLNGPTSIAVAPTAPATIYAVVQGPIYKTTNGGASWSNVGIPSVAAAVAAVDPTDPAVVYAGGGSSFGMFKTVNGGTTWTAINTGITNLYILTIEIDPSAPSVVYAGTNGGGLFKTTNGGASWAATGSVSSVINDLAIDPSVTTTVYAATGSGVYKTTNGGTTWSAITSGMGPPFPWVEAVVIDGASGTIYAGTNYGVFQTTSGGASWTAINAGLVSRDVEIMAIAPSSPPRIYAGTEGGLFLLQTCGDSVSDPGEACDDGNAQSGDCCSPTCQLESSSVVCRTAVTVCDAIESCTGASPTCPADAMQSAGGACNAGDTNPCTTDVCDAGGACTHPPGNAGTECRSAAGVCDLAETCSGASTTCPTDAKSSAQCRALAGDCDVAESCDGVGNACPANGFAPSSVTCRGSVSACDAAETCTGSSASCPSDAPAAAGTACPDDGIVCTTDQCNGTGGCVHLAGNAGAVCRAGSGACDVAELCSGLSPSCPPDAFAAPGASCRLVSGECDLAESCTGTSPACPADAFKPLGVPCTDDGDPCTPEECGGSSSSCTHGDADADSVGDLCDNCVSSENLDQVNSDCNDPDYFLTVGCAAPPNNKAGCCDGGDACDACPAQNDNASCDPNGTAGASVGPDGDTITTPDGAVSVVIPPLALPSDTSITVTENGPATRFTLDSAAVFSVSMRPEDLRFDLPVTITFTWKDDDNDGRVDRGTCVGGADDGDPCDNDSDCTSNDCSSNTTTNESALVLKRNAARFSKGGFASSPYKCSDHLSGACATAVPNCSHLPGTGQATVANCCNPTSNTWTFKTCSFSEFFLGLTAGDLVPGSGSTTTDCTSEWGIRNPLNDPFADKKGLPNFKQTCMDGDPSCDADGLVNGVCDIEIAICLNVDDPRLPDDLDAAACTPGAVDQWIIKKPKPDSAKPMEASKAIALRNAVAALATSNIGGTHQEVVTFATPLTSGDECTAPVHIQVPLKSATRKGKAVLKMQSIAGTVRDSDKLKITCLPSDAAP